MTDSTSQPTHNTEPMSPTPMSPIFGQRRSFYFNDNGQPAYQVYDLDGDDFCNPQPGDEFFHGEVHDTSVRILGGMLQHHYRYSPTITVHVRPKLILPDQSLDQPMPDVVLVDHLSEPLRHRTVLDIAAERNANQSAAESIIESQIEPQEEVKVRAIFEVTSPLLAEYDLGVKASHYAQGRVPEYWIIDSGLRPDQDQLRFTILGFRLEGKHFEAIPPTSKNHWESPLCRLCLRVSDDEQSFQLGDLRTGKPFPMPAIDDDPAISAQAEAARRAQSIADQLKL
ncbi:MAG: Uma2 family endonuclease [Caldilineaceae bacterium]|nr:Uma2 family endonuclease [Caldilineaceae bacterium]